MNRITYFAAARNPKGQIEQLFVERRNGKAYSQEFTGVIYGTEEEAQQKLGELNQRPEEEAVSEAQHGGCVDAIVMKMMKMEYAKLKKGDKISFEGRKGVLLSDAEYKATPSRGWYEAKVRWEDGREETFMLNRTKLKKLN